MNSLSYYAQVVIGDELWVSNSQFNGLYVINIALGKSKFVGKFPRYNLQDAELHFFAKKYGDKIYFFPKCSECIDIYDLKTGVFTYIECRTDNKNGHVTAIDAFCSNGDSTVIVPCYSEMPLQELSIKKEAIIKRIKLKNANRFVENESHIMALYACKMKDEIFYPIHGTNKIGSFHLKKRTEKIYSLNNLKEILGDIVFDGSDLWINADKSIYLWNPYNDKLEFVCDYSSEKEGWVEQFVLYDHSIICVPRWLNRIRIIDRHDFTQRELHIDKSMLNKNRNMPWRDVRESFVWRDNLIISPIKYKEAVYINLISYEIVYKRWEAELPSVKEGFFIREIIKGNLQEYIKFVSKNKGSFCGIENNSTGCDILQKLKEATN